MRRNAACYHPEGTTEVFWASARVSYELAIQELGVKKTCAASKKRHMPPQGVSHNCAGAPAL